MNQPNLILIMFQNQPFFSVCSLKGKDRNGPAVLLLSCLWYLCSAQRNVLSFLKNRSTWQDSEGNVTCCTGTYKHAHITPWKSNWECREIKVIGHAPVPRGLLCSFLRTKFPGRFITSYFWVSTSNCLKIKAVFHVTFCLYPRNGVDIKKMREKWPWGLPSCACKGLYVVSPVDSPRYWNNTFYINCSAKIDNGWTW